jgi:hypothetical protein
VYSTVLPESSSFLTVVLCALLQMNTGYRSSSVASGQVLREGENARSGYSAGGGRLRWSRFARLLIPRPFARWGSRLPGLWERFLQDRGWMGGSVACPSSCSVRQVSYERPQRSSDHSDPGGEGNGQRPGLGDVFRCVGWAGMTLVDTSGSELTPRLRLGCGLRTCAWGASVMARGVW